MRSMKYRGSRYTLMFLIRNNFIRNWGSKPQKVKKFLRKYSRLRLIGKIRIRNCWTLVNCYMLTSFTSIMRELYSIDVIMLYTWCYIFIYVNCIWRMVWYMDSMFFFMEIAIIAHTNLSENLRNVLRKLSLLTLI